MLLINPYLSDSGDQARIVARLKDSDHSLVRNKLLHKINYNDGLDFSAYSTYADTTFLPTYS